MMGSSSTISTEGSTAGNGTGSLRLIRGSLRGRRCQLSSRHMDMVEPLQGVGQVAAVVAIVVTASREGQKRHARITAGRRQHLPIGWPGLLVLSAADEQQFPPAEPVLTVEPQRRVAASGGRAAME